MSSEAGGKSSSATKQLDRELHNMVTSITNRTTDLHHKSLARGHGHGHGPGHEDDDEHNLMSVITLAGHNTGATFRSELQDDHENHRKRGGQLINGDQSEEGTNTYVNSNFQAVNNSVMMGGSYTTNDPGVHLEVNDFFEAHHGDGPHHRKPEKKGGKGNRKQNESDDHHEEHM